MGAIRFAGIARFEAMEVTKSTKAIRFALFARFEATTWIRVARFARFARFEATEEISFGLLDSLAWKRQKRRSHCFHPFFREATAAMDGTRR